MAHCDMPAVSPDITRPVSNREHSAATTCLCGHKRIQRQHSRNHPRGVTAVVGPSDPPRPHSSSDFSDEDMDHDCISDSALSQETQLEVARRELDQVRREKRDVRQQLKDVTKMNTRWQKYDKEREEVVKDLTTRLQRSQEKVSELEAKVRDQREQTEELELRWTDARVRAAERQSEVERTKQRTRALEQDLKQSEKKRYEVQKRLDSTLKETRTKQHHQDGAPDHHHRLDRKETCSKDRDLYQMSKRVVDLKEKLSQLQGQLAITKTQMTEQADLYTQQISICLDDFKEEKNEKDKMKKENDEIKKQLKKAEDFASSLKVQITRYQEQQHTRPATKKIPAVRHVHNYYADIFQEHLDDSWDDGGYTLPRDVVRDVPIGAGFDEPDAAIMAAAPITRGGPGRDPPPQYDDRSVMGQVVFPKVNAAMVGARSSTVPLYTTPPPAADLVLH